MKQFTRRLTTGLVMTAMSAALVIPQPLFAQDVDFGDDSSEWARDGECDDMRFQGDGMTATQLLDSDVKHDATDCRTAYEQGRLTLKPEGSTRTSNIIWGDDASEWANDGECDDMRFEGEGMTGTTLLPEDVKHDATDCRTAFEQYRLELRS